MSVPYCPVCLDIHSELKGYASGDLTTKYDCEVCGEYIVTEEALDDQLAKYAGHARWWTEARRASLSHKIITRQNVPSHPKYTKWPLITESIIKSIRSEGALLPAVPEQATNAIKVIGDMIRVSGKSIAKLPAHFYALVGSPNPEAAHTILIELLEKDLIKGLDASVLKNTEVVDVSLTLDGWSVWEQFQKGERKSYNGTIVMKFNDPKLDRFFENMINPAIDEIPGYSIYRVDDWAITPAGITDKIMRDTIRNSAFVLADLTHANNSAYWEAGFAEGLGIPVIYLCEKEIWDESKTHFGHGLCTTLAWSASDPDTFKEQLIAALRNTLKVYH